MKTTNNLKCPFCGAELEGRYTINGRYLLGYECSNDKCSLFGLEIPPKIWLYLIDGKKAQDALNWINEYLDDLLDNRENEDVPISAEYLKNEIASITKQENE